MYKIKKIIFISLILFIFSYLSWGYINLPSSYTRFEGEEVNITNSNIFTVSGAGNNVADIKLLGVPIKEVSVQTIPTKKVIPCGNIICVKLYTAGLLVVNMSGFEDVDGNRVCPAMESGIKVGDIILEINGNEIKDIDGFIDYVDSIGLNEVTLKIAREKKEMTITTTAKKAKVDGKYKIGTWVRDSTAGIGTLTFYDPDSKKFGALGHGIIDSDVGAVYKISSGVIQNASVISVLKGERGIPGELRGVFLPDEKILGEVYGNTPDGIYGELVDTSALNNTPINLGSRVASHEGSATILCTTEGETIAEYQIEIQRILPVATNSSKGMIIKITDKNLLSKTGGIVQGMSGSPIIQDGKLIGAVTHVFVNDPTRGYGIFIENMMNLIK